MSMKILVVDDEQPARQRIRKLIESCEAAKDAETTEATNGLEALQKITENQPDIVILDVDMPEMTGIDLLHQLPQKNFLVIFQTAHSHFAVEAFELSAIDFLLKPYTRARFEQSVEKAIKKLNERERLTSLEEELIKRKNYMRRFVVNVGQKTKIIDESEVCYFSSKDHITSVHMEDISYAYQNSLTHIEKHTDPERFLRIHKNAVINLRETKSYSKSRPMTVLMKNGDELRVARDREKAVREVLSQKVKDVKKVNP